MLEQKPTNTFSETHCFLQPFKRVFIDNKTRGVLISITVRFMHSLPKEHILACFEKNITFAPK